MKDKGTVEISHQVHNLCDKTINQKSHGLNDCVEQYKECASFRLCEMPTKTTRIWIAKKKKRMQNPPKLSPIAHVEKLVNGNKIMFYELGIEPGNILTFIIPR